MRFQTGSIVVTENVNIASCTTERCNHTFEPPSNPPSSYDSVSVAAENVVGVGAARTCTTQTISEFNFMTFSSSSRNIFRVVVGREGKGERRDKTGARGEGEEPMKTMYKHALTRVHRE